MADEARTQANRSIAIQTPLGDDKLLAKAITVREAFNKPFEIDAELLSTDKTIKFDDIVGQNVTIRMALGNGKDRYFNGMIASFAYEGMTEDLSMYRALIVPATWFLSRRSDCKIHQMVAPVAIVEDILSKLKPMMVEKGLTAKYKSREYQVQYRETTMNFIDRLLEQEGITYFFTHANGEHSIVLADNPGAYKEYPGFGKIKFDAEGSKRADEFQGLTSFTVSQKVQPTSVALTDYDFKVPSKGLLKSGKVDRKHQQANNEIFDYPGDYIEPDDGDFYAKLRVQELQTQFEQAQGTGNARGIAVGYKFKLDVHPREDILGKAWLVTSATHRIVSDGYVGTAKGGTASTYAVTFSAVDASTQIRPARITPKPVIPGPQTAFVVGYENEEITVDEFGRVKVHFRWDRHGDAGEFDSCFIRVSQGIAGKGWGQIHIPRHGEEVIVEFLDGDPDRPIITGRVYNGENVVPYALPENKTMSGYKSNSSKGGKGFNEIRFEDKKGEEQIFVNGEKNIDIRNKNDWYELVGHDKHVKVMNDSHEEIKQDRYELVTRDHIEEIGRDRNLKIKGKEAIEITQTQSIDVKSDVTEKCGGKRSAEATKDYFIKAENIILEGNSNITLKVSGTSIAIGSDGVAIETSGKVTIKANQGIELKSDGGDVKIEGLNFNATGQVSAKVEGTASATLKGGVTKIN